MNTPKITMNDKNKAVISIYSFIMQAYNLQIVEYCRFFGFVHLNKPRKFVL